MRIVTSEQKTGLNFILNANEKCFQHLAILLLRISLVFIFSVLAYACNMWVQALLLVVACVASRLGQEVVLKLPAAASGILLASAYCGAGFVMGIECSAVLSIAFLATDLLLVEKLLSIRK